MGELFRLWRSAIMAILNIDEIMSAFDDSWEDTTRVVEVALDQALEDPVYFWDRVTKRRNGQTVATPRNINDLEILAKSAYNAAISNSEHEYGYTAPHALTVHNGKRRIDGTVMPARPWTQHAIAGDVNAPIEYQRPDALVNVPKYFAERMTAHLEERLKGKN
jgi:hypothetical protein